MIHISEYWAAMLLLLPLYLSRSLKIWKFEDSHLWVLSGDAKLQFPGELSCNRITRSANDFCSLLLFIHPSSCYCCYWYCYFVIEFKLLLLLLLILLFYYWIELQPHHKISKLLCQVVHSSNSYCIVIVIVENDNFSFGLEVEKMPMTIKQSGGEKNRLQTKSFSLPGFCPNSG